MKEYEAAREARKYGTVGFDWKAIRGAAEHTVWKPAISEREIQVRAIRFMHAIVTYSRTRKAGQLRLLAARHIVTGSPTVKQIRRRMKCSERSVYRALRFVRAYCGMSRNVRSASRVN